MPQPSTYIIPYLKKYAEMGWKVYPVYKGTKTPCIEGYPEKATSDLEQINEWWKQFPDANVAIMTGKKSGFWVLDVDKKNGGRDTLAELQKVHGPLFGLTYTVQTGGGGLHFYFKYNLDESKEMKSSGILEGIDILGDKGKAIAPPSLHESGNHYIEYNPNKSMEINPAPDWLIDLLTEKNFIRDIYKEDDRITERKTTDKTTPYGKGVLKRVYQDIVNAPVGIRNDSLVKPSKAVGNYIAGGEIEETEGVKTLMEAAAANGIMNEEPARTKRTIMDNIKDGMTKPKANPKPNYKKTNIKSDRMDAKGWKPSDYLKFFEDRGIYFTQNELVDETEVNGKYMTDTDISKLITILDEEVINRRAERTIIQYIEHDAALRSYHPVKQYFSGLNQTTGAIEALYNSFKTNDNGMFKIYLKKFLVGSVAKVFEGVMNPVLVFDGPQGVGKSFFARWVCALSDRFYTGPINPEKNDDLIMLIENWVWEIAELGSTTRKADREALKAFVGVEGFVKVRPPYARKPIKKPPMASFIGTINNEAGFLTDPTGNRRFHVITIKELDWTYTERIPVNDVWAEAYHLYKTGFDYNLTSDEARARSVLNS